MINFHHILVSFFDVSIIVLLSAITLTIQLIIVPVAQFAVENAGLGIVAKLYPEQFFQFSPDFRRINRAGHLNTTVEVTWHPVGRRNINIIFSTVGKQKCTGVLEVFINDTNRFNILAQVRIAGFQPKYAANDQLNLHSCLACLVEFVNHFWIDEAIHFQNHVGRLSLFGIGNFLINFMNKKPSHRERTDNDLFTIEVIIRMFEKLEHIRHITSNLLISSH